MRPSRAEYPYRWRLMDRLEAAADRLFPRRWSRWTGWLMLAPALLLVAVLLIGLVQIADASLHTLDRKTFRTSAAYSLDNYRAALDQGVYLAVLWRSVLGAAIVTLLTLLLAFPYGYVMVRTRSSNLRKLLLIALFLPFFIGQVVRAYGWLIILGNGGLVNDLLGLVGVPPQRLLFNYPAVLFGLVQYMLPFAVLMLAPALTAIPEETEAAAGSLGANWLRTLWHVVLPMARPGLVGAGLVVVSLTLTDFAMPAILGGGGQDFIANAIYDQFFRTSDQGLGAALTLLLVGIGSLVVGAVFTAFGAGTLAMGRART
ncbi:ABC transporter permease [Rhodobacter ferrooxidans]|uniref:Binding-protein-dependent transport systems inner membrane component n=1 Tax=Rhodobacter ferrooxidans TaxID=371731 RepID=C8RZG3_9RHOB|nr:ABC transporter permease [Rhodobacter sp. SW2]EEW25760.1 binding-protein-dependent transport systems inner membrane component [Rhodobacter sp. SW2]